MDASLNFSTGSYSTTTREWDECSDDIYVPFDEERHVGPSTSVVASSSMAPATFEATPERSSNGLPSSLTASTSSFDLPSLSLPSPPTLSLVSTVQHPPAHVFIPSAAPTTTPTSSAAPTLIPYTFTIPPPPFDQLPAGFYSSDGYYLDATLPGPLFVNFHDFSRQIAGPSQSTEQSHVTISHQNQQENQAAPESSRLRTKRKASFGEHESGSPRRTKRRLVLEDQDLNVGDINDEGVEGNSEMTREPDAPLTEIQCRDWHATDGALGGSSHRGGEQRDIEDMYCTDDDTPRYTAAQKGKGKDCSESSEAIEATDHPLQCSPQVVDDGDGKWTDTGEDVKPQIAATIAIGEAGPSSSGLQSVPCLWGSCNAVLPSYDPWREHMRDVHGIPLSKSEKKPRRDKGKGKQDPDDESPAFDPLEKIQCLWRGRSGHSSTSAPASDWTCGANPLERRSILRHIQASTKHQVEGISKSHFYCDYDKFGLKCNKKFSRADALGRHKRDYHSGEGHEKKWRERAEAERREPQDNGSAKATSGAKKRVTRKGKKKAKVEVVSDEEDVDDSEDRREGEAANDPGALEECDEEDDGEMANHSDSDYEPGGTRSPKRKTAKGQSWRRVRK